MIYLWPPGFDAASWFGKAIPQPAATPEIFGIRLKNAAAFSSFGRRFAVLQPHVFDLPIGAAGSVPLAKR